MSQNKTQKNDQSVTGFLNAIEPESKRKDCFELYDLMKEISGAEGIMWGNDIVGFGEYQYKYASGRSGEWFEIGFSPRKQNISIYLMGSYIEDLSELYARLGKHKTGKSCLYIKSLNDISIDVLKQILIEAIKALETYQKKQ